MECLAKTMVDQTLDTIRSDRDTAYEGIGDVTLSEGGVQTLMLLNDNTLAIWDKRPDRGGKTTWDNVGSRNLPLHNGRDIANGCRNRATDIVDQSHHSGNDH